MAQENVEVVQAMIDAWNRRDDAAAQETFDPEVEVEMSLGSVLDGVYRGYDGLAEAMKFWGAFAEFRSDPIEVVPAGDEVFAAMHHSGRGKASGVAVEMETWQVLHRPRGQNCPLSHLRKPGRTPRSRRAAGVRKPSPSWKKSVFFAPSYP